MPGCGAYTGCAGGQGGLQGGLHVLQFGSHRCWHPHWGSFVPQVGQGVMQPTGASQGTVCFGA
jgi:hypothetical protein